MSSWDEMIEETINTMVCGRCGGKLDRVEIDGELPRTGCLACMATHTATTPQVFELASEYMDKCGYRYYKSCGDPDIDSVTEGSNRAHLCRIIEWILLKTKECGK